MSGSGQQQGGGGIILHAAVAGGPSVEIPASSLALILSSIPVTPNPDDPAEVELSEAARPLRALLHPPSS